MIVEPIFLVAHAKNHQQKGFVFDVTLAALPNSRGGYSSEGKMAGALLPLFKKVADILKSIQPSWNLLNDYHLLLTADYAEYTVKECDSAGLGLAIGLYNVARKINNSSSVEGILGTGMIRLNGSVSEARGVDSKEEASFDTPKFKKLLTKNDISHLCQLHGLLKKYH